ncbi:uncharacterized protein LOC132619606 [Lycium barbarum]|uniref:uncharacterized protein LOC132619606 n=1 Tax=Lycium barbarum TaxID=112863 RepID=UPI00293EBE28|nr:uncharacterized protein LOC132619606 [Lycium barbarum]
MRIKNYVNGPCSIMGDFDSILEAVEKKGGVPYNLNKSTDFRTCMDDTGMTDLGFTGYPFTWCNGRGRSKRISKRLDRIMANEEWTDMFQSNRVDHRAKTSSDHSLMLFRIGENNQDYIKYFRFLNFWTFQRDYEETVQEAWNIEVHSNQLWTLQQKLKNLARVLSKWSREKIGDVFATVKLLKTDICRLEEEYGADDSDTNRQALYKAQAEYIKWLKMQDSILKQKARIKWFEEGDSNTKYFYSVIEGNEDIFNAAVEHFSSLFTHFPSDNDLSILNWIDTSITEEENSFMCSIPEDEEIKGAVFSVDPNSAAGPDGYNGHFYHATWNIIQLEVCNFVKAFFTGTFLTKYYTHTNLVLIPKVPSPTTLDHLRPISLCNVSNKIISKIATLLPKLISDNQSGFVKGRLITENILLTQEIVHGMKQANQGGNVIIKLDMSKAYDKL